MRQKTNTVDYFPHFVKTGKTLYILEGQYKNDGYAFWFKTLEFLASSEDHYYDCSSPIAWQYFLAKMLVPEQTATEILSLLAELGNIDRELWQNKIIWCDAFVNNLSEVYRKRKRELPKKPLLPQKIPAQDDFCDRKEGTTGISATEIPQSKVKKSKVKKKKDISSEEILSGIESAFKSFGISIQAVKTFIAVSASRNKTGLITGSKKLSLLCQLGDVLTETADEEIFKNALLEMTEKDIANINYLKQIIKTKLKAGNNGGRKCEVKKIEEENEPIDPATGNPLKVFK